LNCEDGSLSSHSTGGEHYAMEDILNRSRRHLHQQQTHSNEKTNFNENLSKISIEENEQDEQIDSDNQGTNVLDFSMKLDEFNKQSANRSRSLNPMNKPRSLKRKHQNGLTDNNNGIKTRPSGIFHADAFCGICRKVNQSTKFSFSFNFLFRFSRNFATSIFLKLSKTKQRMRIVSNRF